MKLRRMVVAAGVLGGFAALLLTHAPAHAVAAEHRLPAQTQSVPITPPYTLANAQAMAVADEKILGYTGWPISVRLEGDDNSASYATVTDNLPVIGIAPGWFGNMVYGNGPANQALAQLNVGHEICHVIVGLDRGHDSVFRACQKTLASHLGISLHYCGNAAYWSLAVGDGWHYSLGFCPPELGFSSN